jgi:hypothetical protein
MPWGGKLAAWLHFLNHAPEEGEPAMKTQYTNPEIQKAFTVLECLSADEETRYQAEMRERALRDRNSALHAARAEGELIGEIRMAQMILKQPISDREDLSQKSLEELQRFSAELKAQLGVVGSV